jgi:hypothetical protein
MVKILTLVASIMHYFMECCVRVVGNVCVYVCMYVVDLNMVVDERLIEEAALLNHIQRLHHCLFLAGLEAIAHHR